MRLNVYFKNNSTLSIIKYPLTKKILDNYFITEDMLSNCAVTFSMKIADTGIFVIANTSAELLYLPDRTMYPNDQEYSLVYRFVNNQIKKSGLYYGEFCIDFLGDSCGKLIIPENDLIVINVLDANVKTDVN